MSGTTNSGVTTSAKQVEDGAGNKSCVYLSDDQLLVRPLNDESVAIFQCRGAGGTPLLQVDSTNNLVKVGVSAVSSTTQYAHFGVGSAESAAMLADTHYMIPFNKGTVQTFSDLAIGTGTDPDDNYGVSTTADGVTNALWYVPDDITIDAVHWFHAGDDATGDTVRAHLMSYSIDTSNTFRSGDMGSGVVIADGVDIVNLGYEQIYYQSKYHLHLYLHLH